MTIEERLENLEKEARRNRKVIRWLGVLLGLCMSLWLATGVFFPQGLVAQDVAEVIRAREFHVVDERGEPRVWLGVDEAGPALGIYDERGNLRIGLGVDEATPTMFMLDERENTRAGLIVDAEYGPMLSLLDERGNIIWEAP